MQIDMASSSCRYDDIVRTYIFHLVLRGYGEERMFSRVQSMSMHTVQVGRGRYVGRLVG